jgi:hypothetical protein
MDQGLGFDWASLVWAIPAALALVGLVLILRGFGALFRGRPVSAVTGAASGAAIAAGGVAVALVGLNIQTYQRLSYEQPVAEVTFRQTGPQAFIATLRRADGAGAEYDLLGDEWQIDARVLKWKPWANVLGFDTSLRLERLSGRYLTIEEERAEQRTVHQLALNPGFDLWLMARDQGGSLPVVDAVYGSAAYVPMANGASYRVTVTQSGLVARPTNAEAEAALSSWN